VTKDAKQDKANDGKKANDKSTKLQKQNVIKGNGERQ
jgi:hypothetical protein